LPVFERYNDMHCCIPRLSNFHYFEKNMKKNRVKKT
jgi:hypothetical protein